MSNVVDLKSHAIGKNEKLLRMLSANYANCEDMQAALRYAKRQAKHELKPAAAQKLCNELNEQLGILKDIMAKLAAFYLEVSNDSKRRKVS